VGRPFARQREGGLPLYYPTVLTPILNWFHVGVRLPHLKQIAGALSVGQPARLMAAPIGMRQASKVHAVLRRRKNCRNRASSMSDRPLMMSSWASVSQRIHALPRLA
jgi:hypothetical protein